MPELAFSYFIGSCITFIAVNFNLYWTIKGFSKKELLQLNRNLALVGKYWSTEQGQILDMSAGKTTEDYRAIDLKKSKFSAFIFGTLLIFLSWFGLFFFFIYFLSVNKFAKSRMELYIFNSDLNKIECDVNKVELILSKAV